MKAIALGTVERDEDIGFSNERQLFISGQMPVADFNIGTIGAGEENPLEAVTTLIAIESLDEQQRDFIRVKGSTESVDHAEGVFALDDREHVERAQKDEAVAR